MSLSNIEGILISLSTWSTSGLWGSSKGKPILIWCSDLMFGCLFWCAVMMFYSDVLIWCLILMFLCDVLIWCSDLMFWSDALIWCSDLMFWSDALFWCSDLMFWSDALFWCSDLVCVWKVKHRLSRDVFEGVISCFYDFSLCFVPYSKRWGLETLTCLYINLPFIQNKSVQKTPFRSL